MFLALAAGFATMGLVNGLAFATGRMFPIGPTALVPPAPVGAALRQRA